MASSLLYDPVARHWSKTGSMQSARDQFQAVLLADGLVLVAGGAQRGTVLSSAELYDPATGTWSPTGNMSVPRLAFTMTLLSDGTVLAAGGVKTGLLTYPKITEIYHPETGAWTTTGRMATGRACHTATLLLNGTVLVAGGLGGQSDIDSAQTAEIYDPADGSWHLTANMLGPHIRHTATLLRNGRVLVAGSAIEAELYVPNR